MSSPRRDVLLVASGAALALLPWLRVARLLRDGASALAAAARRSTATSGKRVCVLVGPARRVEGGVRDALEALGTEWTLVRCEDKRVDKVKDAIAGAAVAAVVVAPSCAPFFDELADASRGAGLMHLLSAGHEYVKADLVPKGAPVCNSGSMTVPIAEYCVLCALEARVRLRSLDGGMRAYPEWRPPFYEARPAASSYLHDELSGAQVLVIGAGCIGSAIVARLNAFGCGVEVARSTTTSEALDAMLERADVIIVACALTDSTRGLIDERRLALCKASASLVNVSRGPVVDETALFDALKGRRLAHAFLDVWWKYPASPEAPSPEPGDQKWRTLERDVLTMTPHASGWTREQDRRKSQQIATNLDNLARGAPLERVICVGTRT